MEFSIDFTTLNINIQDSKYFSQTRKWDALQISSFHNYVTPRWTRLSINEISKQTILFLSYLMSFLFYQIFIVESRTTFSRKKRASSKQQSQREQRAWVGCFYSAYLYTEIVARILRIENHLGRTRVDKLNVSGFRQGLRLKRIVGSRARPLKRKRVKQLSKKANLRCAYYLSWK